MKRLLLAVSVIFLALAPAAAPATKPALDVAPHQLKFGAQPFGSTTTLSLTITNTSSQPLFVSVEEISVPDTFSPGQEGSTCVLFEATPLEPGESCSHIVSFFADPSPTFAGRQTGALGVSARNEQGVLVDSRVVKMSGTGVEPTLSSLIAAGDRDGIRTWAAYHSIAAIDDAVAALKAAERDRLAEVVLDTNATGEARDKMLRVMRRALAVRELGFYTEVWSYTFVEIVPGGFFGGCNHLFLDPDAWGGLSDQDAWGVFLHESFHSFNCVNGGPAGALDEGSAIWITFAPFDAPLIPGQSLAETTYGTKLYYRDINGQPDYPLTAPLNPTQKLLDVYAYLSAHDPSQLPWNSNERLVTCFNRYFVDLNRNVDFFNVWLPAVKARTDLMLADPECKPL
jgi:hypothetical protein